MKKKTIYTCLLALLSAWATSSCEDIIDVDLNSVEPELDIEGTIRMDAYAEVLLTNTKDFSATNEYPPITDAVVTISTDAGQTETLQPNADGRYVATTITGVERTTYTLTVQYEEVEYTATTYMPPRVEIDQLTLWKMPVKDFPDPQVHFIDPLGEENQYYRFVLSINGVRPVLRDRLRDRLISTEFVDGSAIVQPIFISYEADHDDEDPVKQGDIVTVEMQCIDKGVYKFFETLYNVESGLANPTSNIRGGALGYFGAYSFTAKDIVMEWEE